MNNNKLNITKLEDTTLENISGGFSETVDDCLLLGGEAITVVGAIAVIGCTIAGAVYASKAHKSAKKGNTKDAAKYAKTAKNLSISAASLYVGAQTLAGTMVIFAAGDLNKQQPQT